MSPSHVRQEEASRDPTQLASSQEAVQDNMSPFMKTPLEIRNQIYEYLLSTKRTKVDFLDEMPVTTNAPEYEIDFELNSLPVVAEYDLASRVTYSAIELTLILGTETRDHDPSILMFAGDDMTTFCRFLLRSGHSFQSSLSIAITNVASTPTSILKLLEPFRRLHSVASVRITGQIEDEYISDLITKMSKQAPEIETVLQEIHNTIEEGDQAASIHDFSTAISRFRKAREDNEDCGIHGPPYFTFKRGRFNGRTLHTVFLQTELALNTKLATTYLKLENYSRAHEWISLSEALNDPYRQLAGDAAYASTYSIAAEASEGLGLVERAVEEMKEAVRHDPQDSKSATELVRLKSKMQSRDGKVEVREGLSVG